MSETDLQEVLNYSYKDKTKIKKVKKLGTNDDVNYSYIDKTKIKKVKKLGIKSSKTRD